MFNLKIKDYSILVLFVFLIVFFCTPYILIAKTDIKNEVKILKDTGQSYDSRLDAALKLAKSDDDGATLALTNILKNESNWITRKHVAYALGFSINKSAVLPLIDALKNDKSVTVRSDAALSLGNIRDHRAFNVLISTLSLDPNVFVRSDAAKALGMLGDKKAFDALIKALEDKGTITKIESGEEQKERIVRIAAKDALLALNLGHLTDLSEFEKKDNIIKEAFPTKDTSTKTILVESANDKNSKLLQKKIKIPWVIQVASHRKHKDAKREMNKLANLGLTTYIVIKKYKEKNWYRIRVGFYNSRKEAKDKISELKGKSSIRDAFIIRPKWEEVKSFFDEDTNK